MVLTIAMDGPVGAGKSSVADEVARRLGILHLDTGAMYRAFAWQALKERVDARDAQALTALAARVMPEVRFENGAQRTLIGGQDVTDFIRTPEISTAASVVSTVPGVRQAMVAVSRSWPSGKACCLTGGISGPACFPTPRSKST